MVKTIVDEETGFGSCSTTIMPLDVGQKGLDNLFIGGDVFMQMYYTVFDRNFDMVGLARAAHTASEKVYHYDTSGVYIDTQIVDTSCYEDNNVC